MQTFLPYPNYIDSYRTLDKSRLGNQVYRETKTMLSMTDPDYEGTSTWAKGILAEMWRPYRFQLALYGLCGAQVMRERQWNTPEVINRWLIFFADAVECLPRCPEPVWLGIEELHLSHRAALLYKNRHWYSQFGWNLEPKMDYYWPGRSE